MLEKPTAIIIGAGPGGLTAGLELLERSDINVIILESTDEIGGISRTVNYKGNRIDIGGHRFFSKSDRVLKWWSKILPADMDSGYSKEQELTLTTQEACSGNKDKVMLTRNRVSRIFYQRKFFEYPLKLNFEALKKLGLKQVAKIGIAYISIRMFPIKEEQSLEDFLINRFGRVLYRTFFKDYTEKVWGIPCRDIKPEWGAQRIKGLSISKAIKHSIVRMMEKGRDLDQKKVETSLIEKFLYPKFGPGQLWEEVSDRIIGRGGKVHFNSKVSGIKWETEERVEVTVIDEVNNCEVKYTGNFLVSTMPVKELILGIKNSVPNDVRDVANGLAYRDFITVGVLLKTIKIQNKEDHPTHSALKNLIADNWIYIQENDVKLGRLQIFNNWSPYMVANSDQVWLGLEYFCNEGDDLWSMDESDLIAFAINELIRLDFINREDVLDNTVIKVKKAYPAYFGTYDHFELIKEFTDSFPNMFLVGRNGMHRYNNQDHSMLSAMVAVDNILTGQKEKHNIWNVNTESNYHESKEE
ncbi:NAD(P)/FAD-dependent oxidoreductase [Pedobacter sp. SG908]|uniref:NAD(P)/FAD-dependent oxidoreductase n=1 Tax=Pedobacter sp. SG908 TaxID=2587135 RepID=UPI00141D925A|nr:NAD(P)/FAD-dependent oxidoreductase [Pedobacter sp. SG908]NII83187.1 protoporphyrinogen oxidase [Pedobacter sp. SG908]